MVKFRIAIATDANKGLEDVVSNVFGRAKTFTLVDIDHKNIINVRVLENPALSYSHGAGPIAIKTLIDEGVGMVIANELGIGASEILNNHNVTYIPAKPGTNVRKAVTKVLPAHKK